MTCCAAIHAADRRLWASWWGSGAVRPLSAPPAGLPRPFWASMRRPRLPTPTICLLVGVCEVLAPSRAPVLLVLAFSRASMLSRASLFASRFELRFFAVRVVLAEPLRGDLSSTTHPASATPTSAGCSCYLGGLIRWGHQRQGSPPWRWKTTEESG